MRSVSSWVVAVIGIVIALGVLAACGGEKKEPLTPDNPNADPLMLEAGAGILADGGAD